MLKSDYFSSDNKRLRKAVAILFICILAFNIGGYRLAISLLQVKADQTLETQIDGNDYDEAQLIEMRVPLNMPYQNRHTDFERHYGEINIDGKAYTYVKRKIDGDVLVLKCIANESKQALQKTANNLAQSNSGQEQENNSKKQHSSVQKIASSEYDDKNYSCHLSASCISLITISNRNDAALTDVLIKTPHQPPKC